ncbi:hypothetical protein G7Y89_g11087 [Cudoniella acicularis]|uniref:Heterokaryon incompatibility domain-containing protein n=1 Tax=Cudoniella acicularis TaxID=354080 RepID=A0A8H4RE68_9HELO|nr:hypothetical protein G7Y89_g11087 [Cudoniella acicularis]
MSDSYDPDRVAGVKRFFSTFLGKNFADEAEQSFNRLLEEDFVSNAEFFGPETRSNTKKQKISSSTSTRHFQSRLSPVITKSYTVSFYDDPRDEILSDLNVNEDRTTAMDCCDRCQLMTGTIEGLQALVSDEGYEHYTCDEAKQQSANGGCPLCSLIWRIIAQCKLCGESSILRDGIIRVHGLTTGDVAGDGNPFRSGARLKSLNLKIPMAPELDSNQDSHNHELGLVAFQESPVARFVVGRRPDKKLTPDLIQRMRSWLNECQEKHESCVRRCSPVLPSRVVDIGDREGSPIHLYVNQNGTRGQYAALSYCWGGDQPYKTTMSNLNSYTQELASSVFPKTLSDAIKVCRAVGMRYIWIDALCIVQDDPKDKAKQINQMGRIYKDATFTIMAASAKSVSEGFLGNTKVDAPEAKLPFHIDEDSFGAIFVRSCFNNNPYFLDGEPIFNRAWTLQEMLLPSRMLMFDSYQVMLKCGVNDFDPAMDTYLYPESRINSRTSREYGMVQNFHLENLAKEYEGSFLTKEDFKGFTERGHSRQSQIWTSLMAEYSRRDISVIDDRYSALAGVTEELQKIWGGKYIAGLWENSLVQHLGWSGGVNNEEFGGRKWESRLEGPSWSWMCYSSAKARRP